MNVNTLSILSEKSRIDELLQAKKIPSPEDKIAALMLLVKSSGVRSQEEYAGLAITLTRGSISGDDLTKVVAEGFPQAKVGKRHGPYYLSHARTGKLVVPEDCIPGKGGRKATVAAAAPVVTTVTVVDPALQAKIDELEAQIALIRDAKSIKEVRAALAATETNEE